MSHRFPQCRRSLLCPSVSAMLIAAVVATGALPGVAQTGVTHYAVICGIADYPGTVNDLSYTDDDAEDFRDALLASPEWDSANLTFLMDSAVTRAAVQSALQAALARMIPGDTLLFYYSGHGSTIPDASPYDETDGVDETLYAYDGDLSDDTFSSWLSALPAGAHFCGILDTCHSGGLIRSIGSEPDPDARYKGLGASTPGPGDGFAADVRARLQGTRDVFGLADVIMLSACAADELSQESGLLGHGVFTYYLLEGLGPSLPADTSGTGGVSAEEAYSYLSPKATSFNPTQHAQLYDAVAGELFLASTGWSGGDDPSDSWDTTYMSMFERSGDLRVLRAFRDRVLMRDALGALGTAWFYEQSEAALRLLNDHPDLAAKAGQLVSANREAVMSATSGGVGVINDARPLLSFLREVQLHTDSELAQLASLASALVTRSAASGEPLMGFELRIPREAPRPASRPMPRRSARLRR